MIEFLNPPDSLNTKDPVPIYISATGPKALELAGETGDGVILWGLTDEKLLDYHLSYVKRGAEKAGKKFEDLYVVCMTAQYFSKPGESLESLRQHLGHLAISSFNLMALSCRNNPKVLPAEFRDEIMACKDAFRKPGESAASRHIEPYKQYVASFRREHEALVTEKMIKAATITGTPEECVETIRRMEKAGVHQVAVQPGFTNRAEHLRMFVENVIQKY